MTPLVDFPMPGISCSVPASARSRSSAPSSGFRVFTALRKASTR